MRLAWVLIALGLPSLGFAEIEVPREDAQYKYYLGASRAATSLKDGIDEAFEHAVSQAITENFGVTTQIDTDAYTTASSEDVLKRFRLQSGRISLKGFERVDMKHEYNSKEGRFRVMALYRYSKKEIERELLRDRSIPALPNISSAGSGLDATLGGISVKTHPPFADVYLDESHLLKTPLQVLNQLEPGEYTLRIDHPEFETIEEKVNIRANEIVRIEKTLRPAKALLNVDSSPQNASVKVNGKPIGQTPIQNYEVFAGQSLDLEVSHPDTYPSATKDITLRKDETRNLFVPLAVRPGTLVLFGAPDAEVTLDGTRVDPKQRTLVLAPGRYRIVARKDGYEEFIEWVGVEAQKRSELKIKMVKAKEPEFSYNRQDPNFYYQASDSTDGGGFDSSSFPLIELMGFMNLEWASAPAQFRQPSGYDSNGPTYPSSLIGITWDLVLRTGYGFGAFVNFAKFTDQEEVPMLPIYRQLISYERRKLGVLFDISESTTESNHFLGFEIDQGVADVVTSTQERRNGRFQKWTGRTYIQGVGASYSYIGTDPGAKGIFRIGFTHNQNDSIVGESITSYYFIIGIGGTILGVGQ